MLLSWFTDYLADRSQRVLVNGTSSEWGNIEAGVPQGSVLGPLLFLMYINDLTFVIKHCDIRLFADDTCLFIRVDDHDIAAEKMNEDLVSIHEWAKQWLVTFSAAKTKTMIITNRRGPRNYPPILYNNESITAVSQHKHLGLVLSHDLQWSCHINEICVKSVKRLQTMKYLKFKVDRKSLESMYFSYVRPLMEYGDVVWAGARDKDLVKLDRIHVDAMRIVTGATARSNIAKLYEDTGWSSLHKRRSNHKLSLFYKIKNSLVPSYLKDLLPPVISQRTNYPVRTRNNLDNYFTRTETFRCSFIPSTINLWNSLNNDITAATSIDLFNMLLTLPQPPQRPYLYFQPRLCNIILARMRIGCSKLNADLYYNLHVTDNPKCECGVNREDASHYFLCCPLYDSERRVFRDALHMVPFTVNTFLYGCDDVDHDTNRVIFDSVSKFIVDTRRFE